MDVGARRPGLAGLLAGCAKDAPQDIFQPEGEGARKINDLQVPVFIVAGVVGVLVVRGRAVRRGAATASKPATNDGPPRSTAGRGLEITWTIIPALILVGVAVPTVATVIDLADTPDDAIQIDVVGQQWWWEFNYPGTTGASSPRARWSSRSTPT